MGFSLKKLVKGAVADVNVFDGGKSHANMNGAPRPASTARPGGVAGFARGVGQTINRDIAQPVMHIPQAIDQSAIHSSFGRGAQAVGLGALQAGVEGMQGVAGLGDAINHKLGTYQGTSPFTRAITHTAQNVDATAKAEHSNPLLYHGAQVGVNVGSFGLGGGTAKLAASIPKVGRAVDAAGMVAGKAEQGANALTKGLREGNVAQRVAGNTVKNVLNPKYQAANAAFTGLQSGQDIAKGNKVTPASVTTNLVIGGVGFPAAGAVTHEVAAPVVKAGVNALRDTKLIAPSRLNPTEVAHLSEYSKQFRSGALNDPSVYNQGVAAAQKAGISHTDTKAIDELLGAHRSYQTAVQQRKEALQKANTGIQQFAQDHPIGMTSGAVDSQGNKLGLNGKPLNPVADPLAALKQEALKYKSADEFVKAAHNLQVGENTPFSFEATNKLFDGAPKTTEGVTQRLKDFHNQAHTEAKGVAPQVGKTAPIEKPKPPTPFQQNLQDTGLAPKPVPRKLPPITQNSLTSKATKQNISPETAKLVSGEGFVRNTKQLQDTAVQNADKQGLNKTILSAHEAMAVPAGKIDDTVVAHVQQAIERADAAGRTQDAVGLHDALSEHLRKQGQTIQAASLLYKLSPRGLFYKATKDLKTSGTKMTPELETKLRTQTDAIKNATTPEEKQAASAIFHKTVADNLKKSAANNVLGVWKAGLLSGPLTQAGNFASNATFATLHGVSNPLAVGIDKMISLGTKEHQRTKTLTARGVLSGAKEGAGKGVNTMKTGIDARNIEGNKYELHGELNFKNPVIQNVFGKTSNFVFRGMSAADQPFYYSAFKNNLADVAKADGLNRGLSGKQLAKHVVDTMNNPPAQIAETAKLAAQKSVLGQDSKIASSISKIAQEHPALQAVVPFVKVPTNFLTRTLDFTPVGAVKTAVQQIRNGKLDQRALSEALAEATTGTAVIGIGAELANSNLLSGQYPSSDPKEVQRWKTEGIQPNSLKIYAGKNENGKSKYRWINLNYLGPVGLLLGAGKDYHTAASQGDNGAMQAVAGLGKGIAGQSFLTGFSGAANAINDPGRYGKNFVHSQVSSVVPAWLNAVGNATDGSQRQADSTLASVQSRVPGLRNGLPVKQDVYGNALPQRTNPVDMTLDPLKPSNDLSQKNPVVSEVSRLHSVDPNNADLQVTPDTLKTLKVNGQQVKLNDKQKYDLQHQIGQNIQTAWGALIKTPEYQALSDVDKAKALSNLRTDASTFAQRQYVSANNLGNYTKAATTKVAAIGDGSVNVADYATVGGSSSSASKTALFKSPDAEYKQLQKAYDQKIKSGGYSDAAQKIKADKELAKAKVGSTFDKSVRDLYNSQLSKGDIYDYVHSDPNGKGIVKNLLAYGDALVQAGVTDKNKFKNKYGDVTLESKSTTTARKNAKSGSKARSASNTKFAAALKASNTADSRNQTALQNLVKNAKVHSKTGGSTKLKVARATLKKQSVKTNRVKAVA